MNTMHGLRLLIHRIWNKHLVLGWVLLALSCGPEPSKEPLILHNFQDSSSIKGDETTMGSFFDSLLEQKGLARSVFEGMIFEVYPDQLTETLESFREPNYSISVVDQFRQLIGAPIEVSAVVCQLLEGTLDENRRCKDLHNHFDTSNFYAWRKYFSSVPVSWKRAPSTWPVRPKGGACPRGTCEFPTFGDALLKEFSRLENIEGLAKQYAVSSALVHRKMLAAGELLKIAQVGGGWTTPNNMMNLTPIADVIPYDLIARMVRLSITVADAIQKYFPLADNACVIKSSNDNATYFCLPPKVDFSLQAFYIGGSFYKVPINSFLNENRYFIKGEKAGQLAAEASQNKRLPLHDIHFFSIEIKQLYECGKSKSPYPNSDYAAYSNTETIKNNSPFIDINATSNPDEIVWGYKKCRAKCSEYEILNVENRCCDKQNTNYSLSLMLVANYIYKEKELKDSTPKPQCEPSCIP